MKKLIFSFLRTCLAVTLMSMSGGFASAADSTDPRVKVLLEEGLRLYSERQYVRALDLFKQVQRIEPTNATASEYVKSSEQRIMEWESDPGAKTDKKDANWDTLLNRKKSASTENMANANDIIAARKSLVERMRNRSTNTDNIVQIQDTKRGLDIILFHDQLFLPGLQTLRDEALPILENVATLIRQKGDRQVSVSSVAHTNSTDPFLLFPEIPSDSDPTLPNKKSGASSLLFQDIEATRAMVLFTYLAQRSMGKSSDAVNQ